MIETSYTEGLIALVVALFIGYWFVLSPFEIAGVGALLWVSAFSIRDMFEWIWY